MIKRIIAKYKEKKDTQYRERYCKALQAKWRKEREECAN